MGGLLRQCGTIPPLHDKTVRDWLPKAEKNCLMAGQVPTMHMMQQLVVGGNQESSGPTLEGSVTNSENDNWPSPNPNQGHITPPFTPQGNNQEVDPPKDKTSESGYG